jgi:hypothetical protein
VALKGVNKFDVDGNLREEIYRRGIEALAAERACPASPRRDALG